MAPRLIAISGPLSGTVVDLTDRELWVGRDEANQLTLPDHTVLPCHCVFACARANVTIRSLDPGRPTFVNGLPTAEQALRDGDEIQIGGSLFVFRPAGAEAATIESVRINEEALPGVTIVLPREEVFAEAPFHETASTARLSRDLAALIRISAAINAVRGLVALERPVLELLADVVPASRGAFILAGDRTVEIASAVGWSRKGASDAPVQVSRPIVDRVLTDRVGVLTHGPDGCAGSSRSVLAAPLFAFDKPLGAIVLESEEQASLDEGHLRLLMAVAGIAATALEHARHVEALEEANRRLQAELNVDFNMVGESRAMQDVYRRIGRVAPTESTVLITGESGTGKELVARAIHRSSPRVDRPFVAINCAAITESLLESELFGHEKGAFTGAISQKKGKIEVADGGTVFLDEIGELSSPLQAKLLRVLQDKGFERVGGTRRITVDFRLIAATNRDLDAAIEDGTFRRDLYYRLKVVSLSMPPLRERRDDLPLLAEWFLRRHASKAKRQITGFSEEAVACLLAYDWPGNVRELENAVEHAVVLGSGALILSDDLPEAVAEAAASPAGASGVSGFHGAVKQTKKELILRAVQEAGGQYNAAARLLGLHPNYLHRLIRNLQLKSALKDISRH